MILWGITMTIEHLLEKKTYYERRYNYFKNLEFDILAADFQGIMDLIGKMENYIEENSLVKTIQND